MTVCSHCMEKCSSGTLINVFVFYNKKKKSHAGFFLMKLKKLIFNFRWTIPLNVREPLRLCRTTVKSMRFLLKFFPCDNARIRSISKGAYDTGETDINVGVLSLGTCFSLKVPGVHYSTDERTCILRHIEMSTLIAYRRCARRMTPARLKLQWWPRWTFENAVRWSRQICPGGISKKTSSQTKSCNIHHMADLRGEEPRIKICS